MTSVKHELRRSEIIRWERQSADRHSAKVISTLRENPCCLRESYSIINHFFQVIPLK